MYGKINHKKVEIDGYTFDSETEALFYQQLKADPNVEMKSLIVHPKFELQPEFIDHDGNKRKAINYYADFLYNKWEFGNLVRHVVDIKGWLGQDNAFPLHWKMFDYQHKNVLCLEVLKYSKTTGFVPYAQYKEIMASKRSQLIAEKNSYKGALERVRTLNGKIHDLEAKPSLTASQSAKLGKYKDELSKLMEGEKK